MITSEIPQGRSLNRDNAMKPQKGGEPPPAAYVKVALTSHSRIQELRVGMAVYEANPNEKTLENLRRIVERQRREP